MAVVALLFLVGVGVGFPAGVGRGFFVVAVCLRHLLFLLGVVVVRVTAFPGVLFDFVLLPSTFLPSSYEAWQCPLMVMPSVLVHSWSPHIVL